MRFIIINDYQDYLGFVYLQDKPTEPLWMQVPSRHFRYGNAHNVSQHTPALQNYLDKHSLRYTIVEE